MAISRSTRSLLGLRDGRGAVDGGGLGVAAQDAEGREVVAHCQVQRGHVLFLALYHRHMRTSEDEQSAIEEIDRVTRSMECWLCRIDEYYTCTSILVQEYINLLLIRLFDALSIAYLMKGFAKIAQNSFKYP